MDIDENLLRNRLINEFGYSLSQVNSGVMGIKALHPKLQSEFLKWWKTGEIPTIEIEGYSVVKFIQEWGCTPISAFFNLDYLIRKPEEAKKAFAEGYDTVTVK